MPQSLSEEWQSYLGSSWVEDYYYLHTIGNLTLVTQEWNSSMSNAPYPKKKDLLGQHALKLNSSYFANGPKQWNGEAILERSRLIADTIIQIWPAPETIKATNKVWRALPLARLGQGADPVSYTHLDVYKRQIWLCDGWQTGLPGVQRRAALLDGAVARHSGLAACAWLRLRPDTCLHHWTADATRADTPDR